MPGEVRPAGLVRQVGSDRAGMVTRGEAGTVGSGAADIATAITGAVAGRSPVPTTTAWRAVAAARRAFQAAYARSAPVTAASVTATYTQPTSTSVT